MISIITLIYSIKCSYNTRINIESFLDDETQSIDSAYIFLERLAKFAQRYIYYSYNYCSFIMINIMELIIIKRDVPVCRTYLGIHEV